MPTRRAITLDTQRTEHSSRALPKEEWFILYRKKYNFWGMLLLTLLQLLCLSLRTFSIYIQVIFYFQSGWCISSHLSMVGCQRVITLTCPKRFKLSGPTTNVSGFHYTVIHLLKLFHGFGPWLWSVIKLIFHMLGSKLNQKQMDNTSNSLSFSASSLEWVESLGMSFSTKENGTTNVSVPGAILSSAIHISLMSIFVDITKRLEPQSIQPLPRRIKIFTLSSFNHSSAHTSAFGIWKPKEFRN